MGRRRRMEDQRGKGRDAYIGNEMIPVKMGHAVIRKLYFEHVAAGFRRANDLGLHEIAIETINIMHQNPVSNTENLRKINIANLGMRQYASERAQNPVSGALTSTRVSGASERTRNPVSGALTSDALIVADALNVCAHLGTFLSNTFRKIENVQRCFY